MSKSFAVALLKNTDLKICLCPSALQISQSSWKVFFGKQPDCIKKFEEKIRKEWLEVYFYDMVRTIVEEEAFEYVPLVGPEVLWAVLSR